MFHLTEPGAELKLQDIPGELGLSSLRDYNPGNAYGLVTDFQRYAPGTTMAFETAKGATIGAIAQHEIPLAENKANNPEFLEMIGWAGAISQNETQKARVMQAFSQASTVNLTIYSQAFPGLRINEHGCFNFRAKQQENGDVIVSITSADPKDALQCKLAFAIHPDGSDECVQFRIKRT
jgi:hypothetical protein